jgi:membrane dipeptidase
MWISRTRHDRHINRTSSRRLLLASVIFVFAMIAPGSSSFAQAPTDEAALIAKAKAIHRRIISLDSHIDFVPANLAGKRNYTQRLDTQFDLPKMVEGGLAGLFFSIFVSQTRESQNANAFQSAGFERAYELASS